MDILKASTDWAKSELFSTPFFVLFGVLFIAASIGFWQLGKTEMAKAYIIPTLVAGVLLRLLDLDCFLPINQDWLISLSNISRTHQLL